tara:strand:+ start:483 stop:1301 length:819 start_codon:yes stop_codon:yes gene_type:complete
MKVFRLEEIVTDLYTKGGEYQFVDRRDTTQKPNFYVGPYHTKKGRAYVGAKPSTPSVKLKKIIFDRNVFTYNKLQPAQAKSFPGIVSKGPMITPNDEDAGFFKRFFAKQLNTAKIYEIDKDLYKKIAKKSNPHHMLYDLVQMEWKISGPIFNILHKNVIVEHGIIPTNNNSLELAEQKLAGLTEFIGDSLEYANPREQDNLFTPGDQLMTKDGEEYVGPYHVHVNRPMVGAFHSSKPHDYLIPMNATIFGPGEMTEEEKIINTDAKTYNSLL